MPVEVKRKSNENTFSFLNRFKDKVKKGRVLSLAKGNAYFSKKTSRNKQKAEALRRKKYQAKREFLIKTGKIEEPTNNKFNKSRS